MTDEKNRQIEGIATKAKGKTTTITLRKGKPPSGNLRTVKVVGLPDPTNSETARDKLLYDLSDSCRKEKLARLVVHPKALVPR